MQWLEQTACSGLPLCFLGLGNKLWVDASLSTSTSRQLQVSRGLERGREESRKLSTYGICAPAQEEGPGSQKGKGERNRRRRHVGHHPAEQSDAGAVQIRDVRVKYQPFSRMTPKPCEEPK